MSGVDKERWQAVSPLLDRALDLTGAERDVWLESLRATDPTLAADVATLLERHRALEDEGFLDSPAASPSTEGSLAGHAVGAYTLRSLIGQGGMGSVWLAERSDGRFQGLAAVKLLNASLVGRDGEARFRREGSILARLRHPHIAHLIDAGLSTFGHPYLVLEHVDGERIDAYCDGRRVGIEARIRLFLDVLAAVSHAHANLVVHRDIKPSNVLVTADGRVKLLDFGIAKLLEGEGGEEVTALTRDGASVLTPEYAAPEQLKGGDVTTATDVYALGVLLYLLLAGQHPARARANSPAELIKAILDTEPPRVSDAATDVSADIRTERAVHRATSARKLRSSLRGDLDNIVAKALKKEPSGRYASVDALADDLRRYLDHRPVRARADSVWYQARKFAARHRLEMGAAAGIALALMAGIAIAVAQARASARERDRALEQLRRAEATNDFSSFLLSEATPRGKPISNAELLSAGEALIAKRFNDDARLRVHLLLTLAERYNENQQFAERRRVLQRAYDDSRVLEDAGLRAYAACEWGHQLAEQGDQTKALSVIGDAVVVLAATPEYAEYEASCRVRESTVARLRGDTSRAIAAAERALALEQRRGGAPGRELTPLDALATAYWASYRFTESDRLFRRVAAILEAQGLAGTRRAALNFNNWSTMLQDSGQLMAAVEASTRAVRIARAADSENGASLTMLTTYASALAGIGAFEDATPVYDEALRKARVAGSPRRLITALANAISAAFEAGDADRASRLLAEVERALPEDKSPFAKGVVELSAARVALARGDVAGAVDLGQVAVKTLETATSQQASLQPALTFLARALNASGRFTEALAAAERGLALAKRRRSDLPHAAPVGRALVEIGAAKSGLGDAPGAREAIDKALSHLMPTVGPNASPSRRAVAVQAQLQRPAVAEASRR